MLATSKFDDDFQMKNEAEKNPEMEEQQRESPSYQP